MSTVNHEKKPAAAAVAKQKESCSPEKGAKESRTKEPCSNVFDGQVVSMTGHKLVVKNSEGKECTHTLAKDAKLTCDGNVCKAEDLKAGKRVRVTTKKDDQSVASGVESLNKHKEFSA